VILPPLCGEKFCQSVVVVLRIIGFFHRFHALDVLMSNRRIFNTSEIQISLRDQIEKGTVHEMNVPVSTNGQQGHCEDIQDGDAICIGVTVVHGMCRIKRRCKGCQQDPCTSLGDFASICTVTTFTTLDRRISIKCQWEASIDDVTTRINDSHHE